MNFSMLSKMITSNQPDWHKLAAIKKHFEGYSSVAYADTGGVWTIGYGSTYNHNHMRKVAKGDVINEATAIKWMEKDTEMIVKQINQYIKVSLNANQMTAICDYVYNRGIGNMLRTQLDELINANPNDIRIKDEILRTGLKDKLGNLLWGLGRRRRAEAHLYFTGDLRFDFPKWGV
jgi:lysozyme